ncbi:MAG TPA: metallophosphoesterase [Candidatus Binataceae bacterium]|jgi:predicted MPP superfamily phosphohydrolase|nr:metallophosphoesterase [Candidatus Binataceae bacterium]
MAKAGSFASVIDVDAAAAEGKPPPRARRPRPPVPLRPLHRIWRRTLDEIDVARVRLPVRGLPAALEGLVACQLSDFHVDRDEDLERLILAVRATNQQHPDFVFLTGDYFTGPQTMRHYLDGFRDALRMLAPRLGVFAVAGNHDHWSSFERIAEALRLAGVRVLANESHRVALRGETLVVVGIDDLWSRRAEPSRAFAKVRPGECTVVLAHNPDTALYARHFNPGVMLSGHTHGGVVRLPYYGSPLKLLRIGKEFYAGLNRYRDFYIYTNRGLGTYWLRIRINCRPEVSHFHLTPLADSTQAASESSAVAAAATSTHGHPARRIRRPLRRLRKRA